jgi:hypothetical protein
MMSFCGELDATFYNHFVLFLLLLCPLCFSLVYSVPVSV